LVSPLIPYSFRHSENNNEDDVKATMNEWFATGEVIEADDLSYSSYETVKSLYE